MMLAVLTGFAGVLFFLHCAGGLDKPVVRCGKYVDEGGSLDCPCKSPSNDISTEITWPGYSNSSVLELRKVQRDYNGKTFICQLAWNNQTSEVVYTLYVAYGPDRDISIAGPSSFATNGSQTLTLTCQANDVNPAPIYTWMGVICDNGNRNSTCSYRPQPHIDDKKTITCRAANPSSRALLSATTNLTLQLEYPPAAPPVVAVSSQGPILRTGDTLTCSVTGGKPPVSQVVFSCSSPAHPDQADVIRGSSVTSSLTIDTSDAIGVDTRCVCSAVWKPEPLLYAATNKTILHLEYTASIVSFSANNEHHSVTVDEGTRVVFRCRANGRPAPTIMLKKQDRDETIRSVIGEDELVYVEETINCQETGTFVCIATNNFPNLKSSQIDVKCGHLRMKIIIGGSVSGGVMLIIVVIVIIVLCRRKYRRYERPRRRREEENPYTGLQVAQSGPAAPEQPENYELVSDVQTDENLYDELTTSVKEKPKKRRCLCLK